MERRGYRTNNVKEVLIELKNVDCVSTSIDILYIVSAYASCTTEERAMETMIGLLARDIRGCSGGYERPAAIIHLCEKLDLKGIDYRDLLDYINEAIDDPNSRYRDLQHKWWRDEWKGPYGGYLYELTEEIVKQYFCLLQCNDYYISEELGDQTRGEVSVDHETSENLYNKDHELYDRDAVTRLDLFLELIRKDKQSQGSNPDNQ